MAGAVSGKTWGVALIDTLRRREPAADEQLRGLEEEAREMLVSLATPAQPRPFCWGVLIRHRLGASTCTRSGACTGDRPGGQVAEAACEVFAECLVCQPRG